jgi:sugar lactone lactonase YvrE
LWVTDQGDSKIYLASATGSVLGNIDIIATKGGPGGGVIGGIHVETGVGPDVFIWHYGPASSPFSQIDVHNPGGSLASIVDTHTNIIGGGFNGVAANTTGTVYYVTDQGGNAIHRYSSGGSHLTTFATSSGLQYPWGICLDAAGDIWMADQNAHFVRKYDGTTFAQVLQIGPGSSGSADGQFSSPRGLYADASNRLFVCDTGNSRIQVFDLNGVFLGKFGSAGSGANQLHSPSDITVNGTAGSAVISIADYTNHRISQWTG